MKYLYLVFALVGLYFLRIYFDKLGEKYSVKLKPNNFIGFTKYEKRFTLILLLVVLANVATLFLFLEDFMDAVYMSSIIFGPIIFGLLIITIRRFNWFIDVQEDKIIYRNSFGQKKEYDLNKLEYKYNIGNYIVYNNNKKLVTIPLRYHNSMALADRLYTIGAPLKS